MGRVLLIDSNESHARALRLFLERQHYSVTTCWRKIDAITELKRNAGDFDFLIIDLTADSREDWEILNRACKVKGPDGTRPGLVCTCRGYRGPGMRIQVERLGGRLVYERRR